MSGELKSVLNDGPIEGETLVSVCVITYNHGKYIRQCLDGILMQKVNFPYEILIHDDASPDETADIIREYWEKYPTVIKPILREENQYSKGVDVSRFNFDRAKAKYIAQCEGDDYWTDDGKLQMQVDFLEEHGEYVGTAHNVRTIDQDYRVLDESKHCYPILSAHVFGKEDAIKFQLVGQTASLLHRNIFPTLSKEILDAYYACRSNGDQKLSLLYGLLGEMYFFEECMADHRKIVSEGDSWSARTHGKNMYYYSFQSQCSLREFAKVIDPSLTIPEDGLCGIWYGSVLYFLRHPCVENLKICLATLWDFPKKISLVGFFIRKFPNYILRVCRQ
ncbi:MAG: glycosyltransferase [Clostridium lundense]|nr:glycosyltransferase [Clostridium lundense]MBE6515649.1 glycosyltransferase [Methanocorpusculum parvum]